MTEAQFSEFVKRNRWIYAKSYAAYAPHEYVVRGKCSSNIDFDKAGEYIISHGMRMFYYKNERKYLIHDGYFYWIMRDENNYADAVINRCKPDDYDIVFMRRGTQAGKNAREFPRYQQMTFAFE